jgi:hypothetical protein
MTVRPSSLSLSLTSPALRFTYPFHRHAIARVGENPLRRCASCVCVHPDGQRRPILSVGAAARWTNQRAHGALSPARSCERTRALALHFPLGPPCVRAPTDVWARLILDRSSLITSPAVSVTRRGAIYRPAECNNCRRAACRGDESPPPPPASCPGNPLKRNEKHGESNHRERSSSR